MITLIALVALLLLWLGLLFLQVQNFVELDGLVIVITSIIAIAFISVFNITEQDIRNDKIVKSWIRNNIAEISLNPESNQLEATASGEVIAINNGEKWKILY